MFQDGRIESLQRENNCDEGESRPTYRAGSIEFGAVRPHRTSPNHCDEGGSRLTEQVRVSSVRFHHSEPL